MDPEANLLEQRELAARIVKAYDGGAPVDIDDAARLAELVIALDAWLCKGGFKPATWEDRRTPMREFLYVCAGPESASKRFFAETAAEATDYAEQLRATWVGANQHDHPEAEARTSIEGPVALEGWEMVEELNSCDAVYRRLK